jgi:hypothetical protein
LKSNYIFQGLKPQNLTTDLFPRLKDSANSKFIFNDSVINTISLDGGSGVLGVIHQFQTREPLCLLPITITPNYDKKTLGIKISLSAYNKGVNNTNIYFRFSIIANINLLSIRKKGVGRSTIIYDLKINEGRNLPSDLFEELQSKQLCPIQSCFCFNIVPNNYDLSFFDSSSLKNVRTLEYDAFNRYLADRRVRKDQLMVVFNKKSYPESFTFFSIFTRERIGAGQFALAILINLISGILLYLPSYRTSKNSNVFSKEFWSFLPTEVYIAIFIGISLVLYFIWPTIAFVGSNVKTWILSKTKRNK